MMTSRFAALSLLLFTVDPVWAFQVDKTRGAFRQTMPLSMSLMPDNFLESNDARLSDPSPSRSPLSFAKPENQINTGVPQVRDIWETSSVVEIQGKSLRTWSFPMPTVNAVQVLMKTDGRPLNANIDLWQGPNNTPQKMAVYIEDGSVRPFTAVIFTPDDYSTVGVYNTGQVEFPLDACVEADLSNSALIDVTATLSEVSHPKIVQGGAVFTTPFAPAVSSVQILLRTDGRPLNARIELLQGPNNNKQVMEVYTEDGMERPFFCVLETPGVGNVVRIVNTGSVEFPMFASAEPFIVEGDYEDPIPFAAADSRDTESANTFTMLENDFF